jgi:hypothetical protein
MDDAGCIRVGRDWDLGREDLVNALHLLVAQLPANVFPGLTFIESENFNYRVYEDDVAIANAVDVPRRPLIRASVLQHFVNLRPLPQPHWSFAPGFPLCSFLRCS